MKNSAALLIMFCVFGIVWVSCAKRASVGEPITVNSEIQTRPEAEESQPLYKIGKGDVLEVITWKEPDFSREVPVRMDGMISFPLLKDIQAADRTTAEIENEIRSRLKQYVTHPIVSVSVKTQGSKKFYIIGEVQEPGEYPFEKDLTVLQALALAGGFTEWASKKEVLVIRDLNGKKQNIRVNYRDIEKGYGLSQNIQLRAEDTIVVP